VDVAVRRQVLGARAVAIGVVALLAVGVTGASGSRRHPHAATRRPFGGSALCNRHFTNATTFAIPGRGLALSWAPAGSRVADGHAIAVGGHLVGSQTFLPSGERYDTKLFDAATGAYLKRFGVHYWWAVANAWTVNPYLGEVIADGGGDHVMKLFFADGAGTAMGPIQSSGTRGRYAVADGALPAVKALYGSGVGPLGGWLLSLAFSPDGRWLAGATKDRTIRIWQVADDVAPQDRLKVVKVFYDPTIGAELSVRWSPDGRSIAAGERHGRVAIFAFDPERDRWDDDTIAAFAGLHDGDQVSWLLAHLNATTASGAALVSDAPVWQATGVGAVWNVRWSPDGRWLAAAGEGRASVFDVAAGGAAKPLGVGGHGLDFSPDGRWLAVGGGDQHVYLYDAASTPPFTLHDVLQAHTESVVGAVAWSSDGSTLASVAGGPLLGDLIFNQSIEGADDNVRLWTAAESDGVACAMLQAPGGGGDGSSGGGGSNGGGSNGGGSSGGNGGGGGSGSGGGSGGGGGTTGSGGAPLGPYPGFGFATTGGQGHAVLTVTNAADSGPGSLRDALAAAKSAGGAVVRFAVAGAANIHPTSPLVVPANTTIDAVGVGVTIWGGGEGGGRGLLDVCQSNVIVAGLAIRDALNDGIQIEPRDSATGNIANIVVDRCSITNSADGGIDVTGHGGRTVSDVTLIGNYIAGSGRYCYKGLCGGGSLFKYGATNGSYYANFFDDNLERTPLISGSGSPVPVVADLRYNVTRGTQSSAMSVRDGASANVVGNWFLDPRDGAMVWTSGHAFFDGGNTDQNTGTTAAARHLAAALPVPALPVPPAEDDVMRAGGTPRDAVDQCYVALPTHSFSVFNKATCDTGP
jgi:WD40 repeat protein